MSSRVTTSANIVLGLDDMNAADIGVYIDIATKLGIDVAYFSSVRAKLIRTSLQRNPMHPYWDVERYVQNFERGLKLAWSVYLSGNDVSHIYVLEEEKTNAEERTEL